MSTPRQWRPFVVGAASIAAVGTTLVITGTRHPAGMLLLTGVWSGSLLVFARIRSGGRPVAPVARAGMAMVSPLLCAISVPLTGGVDSIAFYGLAAVPLLQAGFLRGEVAAAVAGAVTTLGAGLVVAVLGDAPALMRWIIISGALAAAAVHAAVMYRRVDRDSATEAARREADAVRRAEVERQALEAALRQATSERLAAVGRMAAAVAHEVNNPLAYVTSNLQFLRNELSQGRLDKSEWMEILEESIEGMAQIRQIATDLRTSAREESVAPESFDLHEVVDGAVRMARVRAGERVKIHVEVPDLIDRPFAAPARIRQVLLNLVANAVDATRDQPCARDVHVRAHSDGEKVLVVVEDTGKGLPPGWRTRLFQPFFTTKSAEEGTGLGLSLSRRYVQESGGALWAEPRAEGGARFCVALPVQCPSRAAALPEPRAAVAVRPVIAVPPAARAPQPAAAGIRALRLA